MNTNTHGKNKMNVQSGFTIIEVMIALVILAVGLLALATMQIVSIRSNAFSSEMTYATMLAQDRLEQIRNMDYDDVTAGNISGDVSASEATKGMSYTITGEVDSDKPATDMKTVTLQIDWTGTPAGSAGASTVGFSASFSTIVKK
jgi:type IV pilus assembly protein PilV